MSIYSKTSHLPLDLRRSLGDLWIPCEFEGDTLYVNRHEQTFTCREYLQRYMKNFDSRLLLCSNTSVSNIRLTKISKITKLSRFEEACDILGIPKDCATLTAISNRELLIQFNQSIQDNLILSSAITFIVKSLLENPNGIPVTPCLYSRFKRYFYNDYLKILPELGELIARFDKFIKTLGDRRDTLSYRYTLDTLEDIDAYYFGIIYFMRAIGQRDGDYSSNPLIPYVRAMFSGDSDE